MIRVLSKEFLSFGTHIGHMVRKWNPAMSNYLTCARGGYHVFDLVKMSYNLRKSLFFITYLIKSGGKVLFISTRLGTKKFFYNFFSEVLQMSITSKWTPGFLTNFRHAKKRHFGKHKSVLMPDLIVLLDLNSRFNYLIPLVEAHKMGIPTMGIVDSNMDPKLFDYLLPGNNDSTSSIYFFSKYLKLAVLEGYKDYTEVLNYWRDEMRSIQGLRHRVEREIRDLKIQPILETYYEVLYFLRDPSKYKDEENEMAYKILYSAAKERLSRSPFWDKVGSLFDYSKYEVESKRGLDYYEWTYVHDKERLVKRIGVQEDNMIFYSYQLDLRKKKYSDLIELLFDARMPENVVPMYAEFLELSKFMYEREKLLNESTQLHQKYLYEYETFYKDISTYQSYMNELYGQ